MGTHTYEILLALGVLAPFVSFWLLVFFGPRLGKPAAGWFGVVLGMGVSLVLATVVLVGWMGESAADKAVLTANAFRYHWADLGSIPITAGVKLDSLTVAMYFMVTFVAFWIFVFSVGYMAGHSDEVDGRSKYHRFFAYLSLFGFSMLGLVISSSVLFLFIFWELVGLCSYLLIGYYFDTVVAQKAQIKAFVTNRVGDFGFLIGLMLVVFYLGTFDLDQAAVTFEVAAQKAGVAPSDHLTHFSSEWAQAHGSLATDVESNAEKGAELFTSSFTLLGVGLATIMGIGLFCGAMGKSAQFPLHVWLPDAMAGPTPVSALIHAATMVAAGVYLVARVYRLMTPDALIFIAAIGAITLFFMSLLAIVQTDIKKCLAYSTLSQLGYMVFGMGCGAWIAALFHLITHAFFKAMMFLGSGQVIEGCHHEQDMRKMGGLIRKMPVTAITFGIGVLAIAGAGIPFEAIQIGGSKIGLGGFFSKDEILAAAYVRSHQWDDPGKLEEHGHGGGHTDAHDQMRNSDVLLASLDEQAHDDHSAGNHGDGDSHGDDPSGHGEANDTAGDAAGDHREHGSAGVAARFSGMKPLPKWMFLLAIVTAYITPFYMTRCWVMTFWGKPRDKHVYDHAHESPLMYVPLVVLAIGTVVASYLLFRPLISDAANAATDAAFVLALDGHVHSPAIDAAHKWLFLGVGFSWLLAGGAAYLMYAGGLGIAERVRKAVWPVHTLLENKYYIDHLYDWLWVRGCIMVAHVARFIDTWVLDLIYDTIALVTVGLSRFAGNILDAHGVDGIVNGISKTARDIGNAVRLPQTGRIRNYVLFAAAGAALVFVCILVYSARTAATTATAALVP